MKTSQLSILATLALAALSVTATAQSRISGHSFNADGAFHLQVSAAAELEASTDLHIWTKFASVAQEAGLDDMAARQKDRRFYRIRGGTGPGTVVGFVKVTVPPGKLAILGNSFETPIRMDTPEARLAAFGMPNPAVKVSLYTNGSFAPHTLDASSGHWTPELKGIRSREGFAVQNVGSTPVTVRFSGPVRQGEFPMSIAAGASLVVPAVPLSGPLQQVVALPNQDGLQVHWYNEETQSYQVSSFDNLDNTWTPKLPDYRPGRAFVVKSKDPATWTDKFSLSKP